MRPHSFKIVAVIALWVLLAAGREAFAATTNWTGALSAVWNDPGNWDNGVPTAANDAVFPSVIPGTGATITVAAGMVANSITFNGSYILTGGGITLSPINNLNAAAGATGTLNTVLAGTTVGVNGINTINLAVTTGTIVLGGVNTYTGATTIAGGICSLTAATQALGTGTVAVTVSAGAELAINAAITVAGKALAINGTGVSGSSFTINNNSTWSGTITAATVSTIGVGTGATLICSNAVPITATAAITKIGAGTLSIAAAPNGTTGGAAGLTVNGGILTVNGNSSLNSGDILVNNGGTLQSTGGGTNSINDARTVTITSGGVFDWQQTGAETILKLNIVGTGAGIGAWTNAGNTTAGTITFTNGIALTGPTTINSGTGNPGISTTAAISGAFPVTKLGTGQVNVSGNNTFSALNVFAGTYSGRGGVGVNSYGSGTITIGDTATPAVAATLNYNSNVINTINNPIVTSTGMTATMTVSNTSGANTTFSGPITLNSSLTIANTNGQASSLFNFTGGVTGTGNLTLNGSGSGAPINFSGAPIDMVGTLSNVGTNAGGIVTISSVITTNVTGVTQNGAAPMLLGAANTYAGAVTVSAGSLDVTATGSLLGAVNVTATGTLAGAGTVNGAVTLSGTPTIAPGDINNNGNGNNANGIGTLTVNNNVTYSTAGTFIAQLGPIGTNDKLVTTGTANVVFPATSSINLLATNGFNPASVYTLIDTSAGGTITNASGLTITMPGYTVASNKATATNVLTVGPFTPTGAATQLTWVGGSGTDLTTAANWSPAFSPTNAAGPYELIFAGANPGTLTNTMAAGTNVLALTFTASGYNLTGNQLTLHSSATSATSPTGTGIGVAPGVAATIGLPISIGNINSDFAVGAGSTLTINGVVNSSGLTGVSLSKSGAGTLTLTGANTLLGSFVMNAGTLNINNANALGASGAGITPALFILNGGTIDNTSGAAITVAQPVSLAGDVVYAGNSSLTFSGATALTANRAFTTNSVTGSILTFSGVVSGTATVAKFGPSQLTLSGVNTFTGNVSLNGGILSFGNAAAMGNAANTLTIADGTSLDASAGTTLNNFANVILNGNFSFLGTNALTFNTTTPVALGATRTITTNASTLTFGGIISGVGFGINKNGAGTLALNGTNTFSGPVTINAGTVSNTNASGMGAPAMATVIYGPGSTGTWNLGVATSINQIQTNAANPGTPILGGAFILTLNQPAASVFAGNTAAVAFGLNVSNAGASLTLSGNNAHTAATTLTAGTLNINSANAIGAVGSTLTIAGSSTINNTSGRPITMAINNPITFSTGATLTFTGSNDLTFGTGTVAITTQTPTINVAGTSTLTIGGPVTGTTGSLTKQGTGTLVLGGANTYAGNTTISAGSLIQNGTSTAGSSTHSVATGATLGGAGRIVGPVNLANGAILSPGAVGQTGTLQMNTLTCTATPILNFTLTAAPAPGNGASDNTTAAAGNDFILGNPATAIPAMATATINITGGGNFGAGTYRLIHTTGTPTGTPTLGSMPPGFSGSLSNVAGAGLKLTVTQTTGNPTPALNAYVWNGGSSGDMNTPSNWTPNPSPITQLNGTNLVFPAAATNKTLTLNIGAAGTFSANSMTFSDLTGYTINAGTNNTIQLPASSATLTPLSVTAGTIVLNVNLGFGSGAVGHNAAVSTGATLTINGAAGTPSLTPTTQLTLNNLGTLNIAAAIGGGATNVSILNTTNVTTAVTLLSGANTYSGTTSLAAGTLRLGSTTALGTSSLTTIAPGATLDLNGQVLSTPRPVSIGSTGVGGNGALVNSNASPASNTGTVTLVSNTLIKNTGGLLTLGPINGTTGQDLTIDTGANGVSVDAINSSVVSLTKLAAGTLTLTAANTYTGATLVSQGTLAVAANNALPATTAVTVVSDTTAGTATVLNLGGFTNTIVSLITLCDNAGNANVTNVGDLTITSTLILGRHVSTSTPTNSSTMTLALDKTLNVGSGPDSIFTMGDYITGTAASGTVATALDASIGAGVNINVGTMILTNSAVNGGALNQPATLTLGKTSNSITASNAINIGKTVNNGLGFTNTVIFGGGSNTVSTPLFTVGGAKLTTANVTIATGGTLTLLGSMQLLIADQTATTNTVGSGTVSTCSFDMSGGTLIAAGLTNVAVGRYAGGGTATGSGRGTLNFGTNPATSVNIANLQVAQQSVGAQTGSSTLGTIILGNGTVNVGILNMGNAVTGTTVAVTGTLTIAGGTMTVATPVLLGAGAVNTSGIVNLNGGTLKAPSITKGAQTATFNGNGGTLQASINNNAFVTGLTTATIQAGGLIVDSNGFNVTIGQILAGTGVLTKTGAGALTLSAANTFTGAVAINGGTLAAGNAAAFGTTAGGATVASGATLDLNGITLAAEAISISGTGVSGGAIVNSSNTAGSAPGTITLAADATVLNNSAGGLTLGPVATAGFVLTVDGTGTTTPGIISGSGGVTKNGAGTLTLGGVQTYMAATAVNGGTLLVNGSTAAASSVAVASGGTLGGTGTVNGTLSFAANGTLSPGSGGAGTLTLIAPVSSNAISLAYDLAGPGVVGGGTNDLATAPAGTPSFDFGATPGTVTVNRLAGFAPGVYTLLSGFTFVNPANLPAVTPISGVDMSTSISGNNLLLTVAPGNTPSATAIVWTGTAGDHLWSNPANWGGTNITVGGPYELYFPATAADYSSNNDIGPGVTVRSIIINSPTAYTLGTAGGGAVTFTGTGTFPGTALLVQAGTHSVATTPFVWTANAVVTVSGGALSLDSNITNGTFLTTFRIVTSATYSGVLGNGSGGLAKADAGTLTLSGANSFTGNNTISGGVLSISATVNLGTGAVANSILFPAGSTGTLQLTTSQTSAAKGITLTGNGIIDIPNAADTWTLSAAGNVIVGAGGLTKSGAGTLIMSQANLHTGGVTINAGLLQLGNATGLGPAASARLNFGPASTGILEMNGFSATIVGLNTDGTTPGTPIIRNGSAATAVTLTVDNAAASTFAGVLQNGGTQTLSLTKLNAGALTLGGVNTYTGTTTLDNGTVTFSGGAQTLGALTVGNAAGNTTGITMNLVNTPLTFGLVNIRNRTAVNALTIDAGSTFTASGGLTMGCDGVVVATMTTTLNVTGAGSMAITGGNVQIGVSQTTVNAGNNSVGVLNLSGLTGAAGFSATVTNFNVGQGNTSTGLLTLTNTANSITATTINSGNSGANNAGPSLITDPRSTITFGTGTNVVAADTFQIGIGKAFGNVRFASQAPGSPGTATIGPRSTAGTNFVIGSNNGTGTAAVFTGLLELSGHVVSVTAGSVQLGIGSNNGTGSTTGIINFDAGTFSAASMDMASKSNNGGSGVATGTLSIGGGTFTVGTGTFRVANQTGTGTGSSVGTVNVTGGGVLAVSTNITDGVGTITSTLNLDGGTLRANSAAATVTGLSFATFLAGGGTIDSNGFNVTIGQIFDGVGALTKTGAGTLALTGANIYGGGTTVSAGLLAANNATSSTGTGAVSVAGGALGGTGTAGAATTGDVSITNTGILQPGTNAVGTLTTNNLILSATAVSDFQLGNPALPAASDRVAVTGNLTLDGVLNITPVASFGVGTYTLFTYTGTLIDNGLAIGVASSNFYYEVDTSMAGQVRLIIGNPIPILNSLSVNFGERLQTLNVDLNGSGFVSGLSTITFGPDIVINPPLIFTGNSTITANITIPSTAALGSVHNVTVTNPAPVGNTAGPATTAPQVFRVINPLPTVASLDVTTGNRDSTVIVKLTGTGYISGVSTVDFGTGITPTIQSVLPNGTEMTVSIAIANNAPTGAHDVTVTNPSLPIAPTGGGTSAPPQTFTVTNPTPALTSIGVTTLDRLSTQTLTLTGTGFLPISTVAITGNGITAADGVSAPTVTYVSGTQLQVVVRVLTTATLDSRDVTVANPVSAAMAPFDGGTSAAQSFIVLNPLPTLASLDITAGERLQTLDVVLTGTGYIQGDTSVDFGTGIIINNTTVLPNGTQLTANITIDGAATVGAHNVTATNLARGSAPFGGGTSAAQVFTVSNPAVIPSPILTTIAPTSGERLQTISVVLTGDRFLAGLSTVDFGAGIALNTVTVDSSTQITASITISGSAPLGAHNVTVANTGNVVPSAAQIFTVLNPTTTPAPTLTNLSIAIGARLDALTVILTGTNFIDGLSVVDFGAGINVVQTVNNGTQITADITILPTAVLGDRNVTVNNPGGGVSNALVFRVVNPLPTLASLNITSGARLSTLDVTLTGTKYIAGESSVDFGAGISIDNIAVNSSTSIVATITIDGAAPLGAHNVTVTNALLPTAPQGGGTSVQVVPFTVVNPTPTVTLVTPPSNNRPATLDVVFVGSNFIPGVTAVDFGTGITVNTFNVLNAGQAQANITIAPTAPLGARPVTISNGVASSTATFTVTIPLPTLSSIVPNQGPVAGGTAITITGTLFVGPATVTIGGAPATSVVVVNPTTITAITGVGTPAIADVVVTNVDGGSATLVRSFKYNGAPVPTSQTVDVILNTPTPITVVAVDPNGDEIATYFLTTQPAHGSITGTLPDITYTPDTGYTGPDSFSFTAFDGILVSDPGTITLNVSLSFTSGPTATPNPAMVLQNVQFLAGSNLSNATFDWAFGDGTVARGPSVLHSFPAAGTYRVFVKVSDATGATSVTSFVDVVVTEFSGGGGGGGPTGPGDADGDGFSNELEQAYNTDPSSATSTPFNGQPAGTIVPLAVTKVAVKLGFASGAKDTIQLSGALPIPAGYNPAGTEIGFDVGGVIRRFALSSKGTAKVGKDSVKVSFKRKGKAGVLAQTGKFTVKISGTDLEARLADEGMTGTSDTSKNTTLRITVLFGNAVHQVDRILVYKAKAGKTGSAK